MLQKKNAETRNKILKFENTSSCAIRRQNQPPRKYRLRSPAQRQNHLL